MRNIILTGILCFLIGGIGGYFIHSALQGEEVMVSDKPAVTSAPAELSSDEEEDKKGTGQDSISRIDYPLIDLYFERDKTYKLELVEYSGEAYKEYTAKGDFFQFNKENFSILTCPSGRGTTPPYILSVYEGKKRLKTLDCFGVRPGIMDDKW